MLMQFYQIQVMGYPKVSLFDFLKRQTINAEIKVDGGKVLLLLSEDESIEILGVHRNPNDLAPFIIGGMPCVYTDEKMHILSPMEESIEDIEDPKALVAGNYLVCK